LVFKAHPPVHIRICAGGCNAVYGRKDKQDGVLISFLRPNGADAIGRIGCCKKKTGNNKSEGQCGRARR
ncbi:MAG: hypothetical protein PVG41_01160, partial [Desulfobacteraceae bacterium]